MVSVYAETPLGAKPELPVAEERDAGAFCRLYEEHFDEVHGLVCRYGVGPGDALDLTQQVFSVALRHKQSLDELTAPRSWLRAIVVRIVHDHYRFLRVRRLKAWLVEHSWAGRAVDERTPEAGTLENETRARVRAVLERMSTKLRDTLVLVELEELDPQEVAKLLVISHNTLRSRRRLARAEFARLWTSLSEKGDSQ
jgi:RNA polymerase sigma-70 factor (ECF subfamily)